MWCFKASHVCWSFFYCTLLGGKVVPFFLTSRLWSTFSGRRGFFFFFKVQSVPPTAAKNVLPIVTMMVPLNNEPPLHLISRGKTSSRAEFWPLRESLVIFLDHRCESPRPGRIIEQSNISKLESILGICLLRLSMVQKCGLPIVVGSFIPLFLWF